MYINRLNISLLLALLITAGLIVWHTVHSIPEETIRYHVLMQLTLPLMLNAILVGIALSASAACLQVLLNNPLADPGIIGISSGASLVAAFLLLSGGLWVQQYLQFLLPVACFLGALLSTALIYVVARRLPSSPLAVVLAGIAISTLCGAVIAWLYYFADAQSMRNLTFWLMGSLYQANATIIGVALPIIAVAVMYIGAHLTQLNQLYLGPSAAQVAGVNVERINQRLLLACAVAVGAAVSLAGSIAFIGLLIPHLMRLLLGHDNRIIIPAAGLAGALLLMLITLFSELWSVTTLPISMLTATIGGPVFILVLLRGQFQLSKH